MTGPREGSAGHQASAQPLGQGTVLGRALAHWRAGDGDGALELLARQKDHRLGDAFARLLGAELATYAESLPRWLPHWLSASVLEASGHAARAAQRWQKNGSYGRAGELYEALGQPQRALECYAEGARMGGAASWLGMARLHLLSGRPQAARQVMSDAPAELIRSRGGQELLASLEPSANQAIPPRYEALELIAQRPAAQIYRGLDRQTGQQVAIKAFSRTAPQSFRLFQQELIQLQSQGLSGVVQVVEVYAQAQVLVSEWLPQGDLARAWRVAPAGPELHQPLVGLARTLGALHRAGVVHGDIKPANVFIKPGVGLRLGDFGSSRLLDARRTLTAAIGGTLAYLAPEVLAGQPATPASDAYSLAVLLYGYWHQGSPAHHGLGQPTLDKLDPDARAFFEQALADEPSARFADCDELASAFAALQPNERPPPAPATQAAPQPPTRRFLPRGGQSHWDLYTERSVKLLPLPSGQDLAYYQVWAKTDHPALCPLYGIYSRGGERTLLVGDRGAPLSPTSPLTPEQSAQLLQGLEALHGQGFCHGQVERGAICIDELSMARWLPASRWRKASLAQELEALERLRTPAG